MVALSIPFMGYACLIICLNSLGLNFQFPLWDTL